MPQSWNRYSYAANSPINFIDLNGEQPTESQSRTFQQMLSDFWDLLTSIGGSNQINDYYYINGKFRRAGLSTEEMAVIAGTALATAAALDSAGDAEKSEEPVAAEGTADSASGDQDSASQQGAIYVDEAGNALPSPQGGGITGSPDGKWTQVRDADGNPTGVRIDGPHNPASHPDPRAQAPHGHVPGVENPDGTPWLPIKQ